jgi:hypothetical protein
MIRPPAGLVTRPVRCRRIPSEDPILPTPAV